MTVRGRNFQRGDRLKNGDADMRMLGQDWHQSRVSCYNGGAKMRFIFKIDGKSGHISPGILFSTLQYMPRNFQTREITIFTCFIEKRRLVSQPDLPIYSTIYSTVARWKKDTIILISVRFGDEISSGWQ